MALHNKIEFEKQDRRSGFSYLLLHNFTCEAAPAGSGPAGAGWALIAR